MTKKRKLLLGLAILLIICLVIFTSGQKNQTPINEVSNTGILKSTSTTIAPAQNTVPESVNLFGGSTYGIDSQSGGVVKVDKDGLEKIYGKKTQSYAVSKNYVFAVPKDTTAQIDVINTETKAISKTIANPILGQIIALDYDAQNNKLFALGSYNPNNRTSVLYVISSPNQENFKIQKSIETAATSISSMTNNLLALFTSQAGPDISVLSVYDFNANKSIYTFENINSYQISPDHTKALVLSHDDIQFFDSSINTGGVKPLNGNMPSRQVTWKNDDTVLFMSIITGGLVFNEYNLSTETFSSPLNYPTTEKVQGLLGYQDGKVNIEMGDGTINQIPYQ